MENMIIYNLAWQKLADLVNSDGTSPTGITFKGKINEITSINFSVSLANPAVENLVEGNIIIFKNEAYQITNIAKVQDISGLNYSVSCLHLSKMLQERQSPDMNYDSVTAEQALTAMLAPVAEFWQVGQVAIPDTTVRPAYTEKSTIFAGLTTIADLFDGFLTFSADNTGGYVNIYPSNIMSADVLQLHAHNTLSVDINRDVSGLTTRLYAFGGSDDTNNEDITIASVNDGKNYIEDYSYYLSQGYTADYIAANPWLFLKEDIWTNGSFKNPLALKFAAEAKLSEMSKPKIDVKLQYLADTADADIWLGKTVEYSDKLINEFFYQSIVGYSINYDNPYEISLETANFIDRKKEIPALYKNLKVSNYVINPDGTTRTKAIEKAVQLVEIFADKVITGTLKSQNNYSWLNLNDGTFSFANGRLTWNNSILQVLGKLNTPKVYADGQEFNTTYGHEINFYENNGLSGRISSVYSILGDHSKKSFDIMCSADAYLLGFGVIGSNGSLIRKYILNNRTTYNGQTQRHIFYEDVKINGNLSCTGEIVTNFRIKTPLIIHSTSNKAVLAGTTSDIYLGADTLPLSVYATVLRPSADGVISLGNSGRRWHSVWSVNGTIQTSGLKDKENIKPLKKKDIDNVKTILLKTTNDDDVYEEDFIDLLDLIADKECTYNYKVSKDKKDKTIPQSAIQLGVIADEISEHKAYKYIGIKEELEDGTINHGLQPLPIAMLAIQGYKRLRDENIAIKSELKEIKDKIDKMTAKELI